MNWMGRTHRKSLCLHSLYHPRRQVPSCGAGAYGLCRKTCVRDGALHDWLPECL